MSRLRRQSQVYSLAWRSTVTEAFGSAMACVPAGSVFVTGGWFGSGWPSGPSDFHMYCSLPQVIISIGPVNDGCDGSSNAIPTACGLDWSLLTTIRDQWPSGRETA